MFLQLQSPLSPIRPAPSPLWWPTKQSHAPSSSRHMPCAAHSTSSLVPTWTFSTVTDPGVAPSFVVKTMGRCLCGAWGTAQTLHRVHVVVVVVVAGMSCSRRSARNGVAASAWQKSIFQRLCRRDARQSGHSGGRVKCAVDLTRSTFVVGLFLTNDHNAGVFLCASVGVF